MAGHRERARAVKRDLTAAIERGIEQLGLAAGREIEALLQDAGYVRTRAESVGLDPPAVCVLAVSPDLPGG
jgi:hypothetical protein